MEWDLEIKDRASSVAEALGIDEEEARILEETLQERVYGNISEDLLEIVTLSSNDPAKLSYLFYLYGRLSALLERCNIEWRHQEEKLFAALGLQAEEVIEITNFLEEIENTRAMKKSEVLEAILKKYGNNCAKLLFATYAYAYSNCDPLTFLILGTG